MNYKINWDSGGVFAVPECAVDNGLRLAAGKAAKVLLYILRFGNDENICSFLGISEEDAEDAFSYWEQVGVLRLDGGNAAGGGSAARGNNAVNRDNAVNSDNAAHSDNTAHSVEKKAPAREKTDTKPDVKEIKAAEPEVGSDTPKKESSAPAKVQKKFSLPPPVKASRPAEILARLNESSEIRNLFSLIQSSLGRPITFDDQNTLIWMYDHLGMGMEVILMLVNYCVSINKTNMHYIEKVALSWAEDGIDSAKKAEEKILRLQKKNTLAAKCKTSMQLERRLTDKELDYIDEWASRGANIEIVMNAYARTVNNTGQLSFPYMNKILIDWLDHGITSAAQADDYSQKHCPVSAADMPKPPRRKAAAPKSRETSFDLELIMEHAKNTPLKVRGSEVGASLK